MSFCARLKPSYQVLLRSIYDITQFNVIFKNVMNNICDIIQPMNLELILLSYVIFTLSILR